MYLHCYALDMTYTYITPPGNNETLRTFKRKVYGMLNIMARATKDRCTRERRDILTHRLTECKEGTAIWQWTKERVAWILRMDPRYIPADLESLTSISTLVATAT